MYDELVKRLNVFRLKEDEYQIIPVYVSEIIGEAADAIEKLTRENKELSFRASQLEAMNDALIGETGATDALIVASKPRWIPVTERLPEDDTPVLVVYLGFHDHRPRDNMLAYIDRDLGWCWWNDDIPDGTPCSVEITHWMPLPHPPKEK